MLIPTSEFSKGIEFYYVTKNSIRRDSKYIQPSNKPDSTESSITATIIKQHELRLQFKGSQFHELQ